MSFQEKIRKIENLRVRENFRLSDITSFKIGGPADFLIEAETADSLKQALELTDQYGLTKFILGGAYNTVFTDEGFRGVILKPKLRTLEIKDELVEVGSGYNLMRFSTQMAEKGLAGAEFMATVPGTVGGAVCMNAGCFKCETADILKHITVLNHTGQTEKLHSADINFGYRTSDLKDGSRIILTATFQLQKAPKEEIKAKMEDFKTRRSNTQPRNIHTYGSAFKNPPDKNGTKFFAGKLLEEAGMKGFVSGGAKINEFHANFMENPDLKATFHDLYTLMKSAHDRVFEKTGISLAPEVRIVGPTGKITDNFETAYKSE